MNIPKENLRHVCMYCNKVIREATARTGKIYDSHDICLDCFKKRDPEGFAEWMAEQKERIPNMSESKTENISKRARAGELVKEAIEHLNDAFNYLYEYADASGDKIESTEIEQDKIGSATRILEDTLESIEG